MEELKPILKTALPMGIVHGDIYPDNTIFGVKRLIGRRNDDADLAKDKKNLPFAVIDGAGPCQGGIRQRCFSATASRSTCVTTLTRRPA